MASEAEADSECSRCADSNQVKDSIRCCRASLLKCLLRIFSDVAFTAGHVDCNEMSAPIRLELSLVTLCVDQFTSVGDPLWRVDYSQVRRHFYIAKHTTQHRPAFVTRVGLSSHSREPCPEIHYSPIESPSPPAVSCWGRRCRQADEGAFHASVIRARADRASERGLSRYSS